MYLLHEDGQMAGAWSSRRGVFAILVLLGVVVLILLVGACGAPEGTGSAPSQSAMASNGASGSAGTGSAPSPSAITGNDASIGGDSVQTAQCGYIGI